MAAVQLHQLPLSISPPPNGYSHFTRLSHPPDKLASQNNHLEIAVSKETTRSAQCSLISISTPNSPFAPASDALPESTFPSVPWILRFLSVQILFPSICVCSDFLVKFGCLTAQFIASVILVNEATSPRVYIPLGLLAFVLGIVEEALSLLRR